MRELESTVDSLITIPNERLLSVLGQDVSLVSAFAKANDVLHGAVQGIADLIIRPGMINVDFADVKTVMGEMGMAMMGTGYASGGDRAREAAESAIRSPLLDDIDLQGARGILVNITAGPDLTLGEFSEVGDTVGEFASDHATVVVGTVIDDSMGSELRVTVVATGLGEAQAVVKKPTKVVDNTDKVEVKVGSPEPDYKQLDLPPAIRNRQRSALGERPIHTEEDMEYLDVPAFLRRQAD